MPQARFITGRGGAPRWDPRASPRKRNRPAAHEIVDPGASTCAGRVGGARSRASIARHPTVTAPGAGSTDGAVDVGAALDALGLRAKRLTGVRCAMHVGDALHARTRCRVAIGQSRARICRRSALRIRGAGRHADVVLAKRARGAMAVDNACLAGAGRDVAVRGGRIGAIVVGQAFDASVVRNVADR
jgi:hypothetical protein